MSRHPRLLLLEPLAGPRIRLVDTLAGRFDVVLADPLGDLVADVRRSRPRLVLLSVAPGRPRAAVRAAHLLVRAFPRLPVALLNGPGEPLDAERLRAERRLAGYLQAPRDPAEVARWAEDVLAGRRPWIVHPAPRSRLARLAARLRR